MLFSSPFFIFIFLPFLMVSFYLAPKRNRDDVLLTGSISFYFWGEPIFCLVALLSAFVDYLLSQIIFKKGPHNLLAKWMLAIGVMLNVGLLIYYKYTNFFLNTFASIFKNQQFEPLNIILPIGISFIVFEKITYLVDIYRGKGEPANHFTMYLNYVFLFPKLLAGPIIKYHDIEKQLRERNITFENMIAGFKRFLIGLAKKVFIADSVGSVVNQVFNLNQAHLTARLAWMGIICFTLQIYFDFSGYSDMAIGLARMLGFQLKENFNMPYIAKNFTDFWRRWHISLSTWIKEYLYIPLGGNKVSEMRMYINLWICFLLSGLWHGANWTFVLWGAYNGFFLILDKLFWLKISRRIPDWINILMTLFFVMMGWVIFRSSSLHQMVYYLKALFSFSQALPFPNVDITSDMMFAMFVGTFMVFMPLTATYQNLVLTFQRSRVRSLLSEYVFAVLGFLALCKVVGTSYTPFLYFKF